MTSGAFVHLAKNIGIKKGAFDCLVVKARTENTQGRSVFVLAVENRTREELFKLLNGGACDVVGDVGRMGGLGPDRGLGPLGWKVGHCTCTS